MNGRPWDALDAETYENFIEYGMYDIFALAELYVKVEKIMNEMSLKLYEKFHEEKENEEEEEHEKVDILKILTIGSFVYGNM